MLKNHVFKRSLALFLALVCVLGILPMSAFAANATPPASITQTSSDYVTINGRYARYEAASSAINSVGLPYVFNEQVNIPGYGPGRALCAYQLGTLGSGANGQKWNFEQEVTHPSLVAVLTYIYSYTNGTFTDAGKAIGMGAWNEPWANLWFMVAQAMSWLNEHGVLIDYNVDRDGFLNQLASEFVAAYKMYHDVYGWSGWITDWRGLTINTIIDSADNGATGKTALDIAKESMNLVWNYPQYFMKYRLWIYDWDKSQPWLISGQEGTPMQKLLVAVPVIEETPTIETVQLTVKKLEAGTNKPLAGATFKIEGVSSDFSVTKTTGADGTIIGEYQTSANGNIIVTGLDAGTYICEEISAPHGYVMDTAPQTAYISGKEQDCITLIFTNSKYGSLLIKKVDSVTKEPLSDVQFFISTSDGAVVGNSNGYFTTDSAGTILVSDVKPGTTLVVKETRTIPGYILDDTPQTVKIDSNETKTLEFRNQPTGSLLVRKVCSVNPSVTLQNAEFKIAYADGSVIGDSNGIFRSDENGEVRIEGLTPGKSVVVTETRAPAGFILDTQSQTVEIKAGKTVSLTFKNQPKGAIIIQKRDSQTNQPLPGRGVPHYHGGGL